MLGCIVTVVAVMFFNYWKNSDYWYVSAVWWSTCYLQWHVPSNIKYIKYHKTKEDCEDYLQFMVR